MKMVRVIINGAQYEETVPERMLLVDFIREHLGLTGTHVGCTYEGVCGACTIHLDGEAVKSCLMLAAQADGHEVTTVEGLAADELSPLQQAFSDEHALQCGFCTPVMTLRTRSNRCRSRWWCPILPANYPTFWPLAVGKVKFHGEPVALILARDKYIAADAAECVYVDYEELPVLLDAEAALAEGAPIIHEEHGTNEVFAMTFTGGETEQDQAANAKEVEAIFAQADVVVKERFKVHRTGITPMEPRGVLCDWTDADGLTAYITTQRRISSASRCRIFSTSRPSRCASSRRATRAGRLASRRRSTARTWSLRTCRASSNAPCAGSRPVTKA